MSDLRIILLIIGVLIIAGVYWWTRWQQQQRRSATRKRNKPTHGARDPDSGEVERELARMEKLVSSRGDNARSAGENSPGDSQQSEEPARVANDLLAISVVAAAGEEFDGRTLLRVFEQQRLMYSDKGIFERVVIHSGREHAVYGVANLVKPGTFPVDEMASFSTPGVTFFLQLPCPVDAVKVFDDFVKTAERTAVEFGGELRDQRHQLLTHQALMQTRESLHEFSQPPRPVS